MNECRKCNWHKPGDSILGDSRFDRCLNPKSKSFVKDSVPFCDLQRRFNTLNLCGHQGKFFESDNRWFWQRWF